MLACITAWLTMTRWPADDETGKARMTDAIALADRTQIEQIEW